MENKEIDEIEEVLDEIDRALNDNKGLMFHQKRIGFMISLGAISLIEIYLKRMDVLKTGLKIDHRWLKKKKENAKELISNLITCPIENLKHFNEILDIAYKIENDRNKFVYGKKISDEDIRSYIDLFFKLKREIEDA